MSTYKPTRELSFSEILEYSWNIYIENAIKIALPYVILGIIGVILDKMQISKSYITLEIGGVPLHRIYGYTIIDTIIQMILSMIVAGMVIKYVGDLVEGGKPTLRSSLDYVVTRLLDIIIASIIFGTILIIGFILFIIPGIIFGIMFILTMQVVVLEGKNPIEALDRSRRLVSGRWALTFILILILLILILLANAIPIIGWILVMLVQSYMMVVLTMLYYSLRAREEHLPPQVI
ncbi:MAG: hypothetical protein QXS19_07770 [Candidatus Methanomethylicia archaeon]